MVIRRLPTRSRRSARGPTTIGRAILGLAVLVVVCAGCAGFWEHSRERERAFAASSARSEIERGNCAKALSLLDRAQARLDLGTFARESTRARMECYRQLDLQELASGHRRLLADFYTDEPQAFPAADGSSVFRASNVDPRGFLPPPPGFELAAPRHSSAASRSKIFGRAVASFEITGGGRITRIRVLEMPHPLLATRAMEALVHSTAADGTSSRTGTRGGPYVVVFQFQSRWGGRRPAEQDAVVPDGARDADDEAGDAEKGRGTPRFRWLWGSDS